MPTEQAGMGKAGDDPGSPSHVLLCGSQVVRVLEKIQNYPTWCEPRTGLRISF